MSKAIVGQSLRLTSTLGLDLSGASSVAIWYKTPAGETGSVTATVTTPSTGELYGDILSSIITISGAWYFMVKATLGSGNVVKSFGIPVEIVDEYVPE
jgi:hypothetical protein